MCTNLNFRGKLFIILIILCVIYFISAIWGNSAWFYITENTMYSYGYDEKAFNSIKLGDNIKKIKTILPNPIVLEGNDIMVLSYSWPEGNSSYKMRKIVLVNDKVTEILKDDIID